MRRKWLIPVIVIAVMTASVAAYAGNYYHADPSALTALVSDETVHVTETDYGWFFDGPSEGDAMVFYPGAKIETISCRCGWHSWEWGRQVLLWINMSMITGTSAGTRWEARWRLSMRRSMGNNSPD